MLKFMNMKWIGLSICTVAFLGGCENTKQTLGLERSAPDEFSVVKRAPLEIPPNYTLRPPSPGAVRPQEQSTVDQAQATVFGQPSTANAKNLSSGENALLSAAGATTVPGNIRTVVDSESVDYGKENQPVVDKLLGLGGKKYVPPESTLNPQEELDRLQGRDKAKNDGA